jgi:hypothetical protein
MTGYALTETKLGQPPGREAAELETGDDQHQATRGSTTAGRWTVLAIILTILLLGGAVGASIWRYEVALDEATLSGQAHAEQLEVQLATAHFWHEREFENEYLIDRSLRLESTVYAEAKAFTKGIEDLSADADPAKLILIKRARAGHAAMFEIFERYRVAVAQGRISPERVLDGLEPQESRVAIPLESIRASYAAETASRAAAARSAATQALRISVLAGLLALIGVVTFAVFAVRLVGRISRRERKLQDLVTHVRSTSGVLSGLSSELRAAAQESAAATTEQSVAVAQTSATIEELAATATAIADNTRAVSAAAEQTGVDVGCRGNTQVDRIGADHAQLVGQLDVGWIGDRDLQPACFDPVRNGSDPHQNVQGNRLGSVRLHALDAKVDHREPVTLGKRAGVALL